MVVAGLAITFTFVDVDNCCIAELLSELLLVPHTHEQTNELTTWFQGTSVRSVVPSKLIREKDPVQIIEVYIMLSAHLGITMYPLCRSA